MQLEAQMAGKGHATASRSFDLDLMNASFFFEADETCQNTIVGYADIGQGVNHKISISYKQAMAVGIA